MRLRIKITLIFALLYTPLSYSSEFENCFKNYAVSLPPETTIKDITDRCNSDLANPLTPSRLTKEKASQNNDFVITPHKQNYILPFTHNDKPNQKPWANQQSYPGIDKPVQHSEAKLQISLKVPLNYDDLFLPNDGLYFGFTLKSFWQVYNDDVSAPFRDTNYRPEMFYQAPLPYKKWGGTFITRLGFEHESNGRSQYLSRSWNRVYVGLGFQKDNWLVYAQPWYRLPEDEKENDGDPDTPPPPEGDDNPNIDDFLGHYELHAVYSYENYELSTMARQNFSSGKGAIETNFSFPLWGRLKGMVQFYNGYGESLIDYDHRVQRIGVGILLTDLL